MAQPQDPQASQAADAPPPSASGPRAPTAPPKLLLGLFVGLFLVTGVILGELSTLLRAMHLPWQPAADLGQGPFEMSGLAGGPAAAFEVVAAWEAFLPQADATTELAAVNIARIWLGVDVVFLLSYVMVGLALVGRNGLLRGVRNGMDRILDLAGIGVVALAAVDLVENIFSALTIGWAADADRVAEAVDGTYTGTWIPETLRVVAVAKWVVALLVLTPIVVLGVVQLVRVLKTAEVRHGLVMARTQILAVVVFAVAMLAPVQLPDVILGWDATATITALVLAVVFAAAAGLWARLLIQADLHPPDRTPGPPPTWLSVTIGAVGIFLAGVLWWYDGDEFRGLAVGIGLVVVLIALSIPARAIEEPTRQRPLQGSLRLPGLLAMAVPVLLGIGLLSATIAWVVYHLPSFVGDDRVAGAPSLWDVSWKPLLGMVLMVAPLGLLGRIWTAEQRHGTTAWNPRTGRNTAGLVAAGLAVLALPTVFVVVAVVRDPWEGGPFVGAVAIAIAAAGALCHLGGLGVALTQGLVNRIGLPGAFRVFGLGRIPIVTLILVWAFVNTVDVVDPVNHHNVRVMPPNVEVEEALADEGAAAGTGQQAQPALPRQSLGAAFATWRTMVVGDPVAAPCEPEPGGSCVYPATPLLLVAAEGGGIRAAYWTASVLDCLLEPREGAPEGCAAAGDAGARPASDHVFIASGASGGSVGIASYVAETEVGAADQATWVRDTLGDDFLSPLLGWWLFAEMPRGLLSFEAMDRAEVHEISLERAFADGEHDPLAAGLRSLYGETGDGWVPRMMLSGASVLDGCQVNVSHLNVGVDPTPREGEPFPGCLSLDQYSQAGVPAGVGPLAGAIDLVDMLCPPQDIRLSTAAILSSRFPFVSPPGRLAAAECATAASGGIESVKYVVDGGYVDNTGGLALVSMLPALDRVIDAYNGAIERHGHCVVPFLVQIDNGGENPPAPGGAPEIDAYSAPLQAIATASSQSRDARVKALVAGEFSRTLQHTTTAGIRIAVALDDEPVATRYARIFPAAEPGLNAPLGWVLSTASQDLLARQLADAASGGGDELSGVEATRQWLEGNLTCTVTTPEAENDG